jgi:hypothetical protein
MRGGGRRNGPYVASLPHSKTKYLKTIPRRQRKSPATNMQGHWSVKITRSLQAKNITGHWLTKKITQSWPAKNITRPLTTKEHLRVMISKEFLGVMIGKEHPRSSLTAKNIRRSCTMKIIIGWPKNVSGNDQLRKSHGYCSRHGFLHQRMNANGSDTKWFIFLEQ